MTTFVVQIHAVQQVHFERTHLNKSLHVIIQKWNVRGNDIWIFRSKFILQPRYKIVSQLQSALSKVKYLGKMSNCHHACPSRGHHVHDRSVVRDGVGQ